MNEQGEDTYSDDDGSIERLKFIGIQNVQYASDILKDLAKKGIVGFKTSIHGEVEPEQVMAPRRFGWKWTPIIRRVGVMGPHPHPKGDIKKGYFWYVTSDLIGTWSRKGQPSYEGKIKNIFATGSTRREAVDIWVANYCARKYNERIQ